MIGPPSREEFEQSRGDVRNLWQSLYLMEGRLQDMEARFHDVFKAILGVQETTLKQSEHLGRVNEYLVRTEENIRIITDGLIRGMDRHKELEDLVKSIGEQQKLTEASLRAFLDQMRGQSPN